MCSSKIGICNISQFERKCKINKCALNVKFSKNIFVFLIRKKEVCIKCSVEHILMIFIGDINAELQFLIYKSIPVICRIL